MTLGRIHSNQDCHHATAISVCGRPVPSRVACGAEGVCWGEGLGFDGGAEWPECEEVAHGQKDRCRTTAPVQRLAGKAPEALAFLTAVVESALVPRLSVYGRCFVSCLFTKSGATDTPNCELVL